MTKRRTHNEALLEDDADDSCAEFEALQRQVALDRSGPDDADEETTSFVALMFAPKAWR